MGQGHVICQDRTKACMASSRAPPCSTMASTASCMTHDAAAHRACRSRAFSGVHSPSRKNTTPGAVSAAVSAVRSVVSAALKRQQAARKAISFRVFSSSLTLWDPASLGDGFSSVVIGIFIQSEPSHSPLTARRTRRLQTALCSIRLI